VLTLVALYGTASERESPRCNKHVPLTQALGPAASSAREPQKP
jgi:hypothetical protein